MGEIHARDLSLRTARALAESEGHVACTAAQVQDRSIASPKNVIEAPRCAPPPEPVHIHRKYVVQQVVSWRDSAEHLAHFARGALLIVRFGWRCAHDCWLVGGCCHPASER